MYPDYSKHSQVLTASGNSYNVIISALSKCIRRNEAPQAVWCGEDLLNTLTTRTESNQYSTYKNKRGNVLNSLMVALLEDNAPSAPWLLSYCAEAARDIRDAFWVDQSVQIDQEKVDKAMKSLKIAIVKSCAASKSRFFQHLRHVGGDLPLAKQLRGIVNGECKAAWNGKNFSTKLSMNNFNAAMEGFKYAKESRLLVTTIQTKEKQLWIMGVCALCAWMPELHTSEPDIDALSVASKKIEDWSDRPEVFDKHLGSQFPALVKQYKVRWIPEMNTSRGFVEREEGACSRTYTSRYVNHPLVIELKPLYDAHQCDKEKNPHPKKRQKV